ncbi:MAG: hypothetical protein ACTHLR_00755, partial [Rhizomicrobium sp.]
MFLASAICLIADGGTAVAQTAAGDPTQQSDQSGTPSDGTVPLSLGISNPAALGKPPATEAGPIHPAHERSNYTGGPDFASQVSNPRAPAWLIVPTVELDETYTDNVSPVSGTKQSDLVSRLSAGGLVSVDTPHLSAFTSVIGSYTKYANATQQDRFNAQVFSTAHATLVPDYIFMDFHANAEEVARDLNGSTNPALRGNANDLQTYVMTASPYATFRLGHIGYSEIRYAGSWVWFGNQPNTPPAPGLTRISDASQQQVHADFAFPGTLAQRLFSDVSLAAQYTDAQSSIGIFRRNLADWI